MNVRAERQPTEAVVQAGAFARQHFLSPRRLTVAIGAGLVVIATLLFCSLSSMRWQSHEQEARQLTADHAAMLAEHAGRVLDVSDLIASQASSLIRGVTWEEIAESDEAFRELQELSRGISYIAATVLVDETGVSRLSSLDLPTTPINVADHAFFKHLRDGGVAVSIGTIIRGRGRERRAIVLARRVASSAGDFRGAALVMIDPSYFQRFYGSVRAIYPFAIDLFRTDGAVIVHFPEQPAPETGQTGKWPGTAFPSDLGESGTVDRARSALDSIERVESYRRVGTSPVYVSVGVARSAVRERWLDETLVNGAFALVALAALLLLVAFAATRAQQEERARAELEASKGTLEHRVRERTAEVERAASGLQRLLAEKDALFREVHHRVKNNLQIISSLLSLYAEKFVNPEVQRSFTDCLNQVRAMGLVHELLYRSPNVAEIDFDEYLRVLVSRLLIFFGRGSQIRVVINSAPLHFDLDQTTPLALIVTEAITNAFKHAFPNERSGTITIDVCESDGAATTIRVSDNGVGMPPDWESRQTRALGVKLMRLLAEQIDGRLVYTTEMGTAMELTIPARPKT